MRMNLLVLATIALLGSGCASQPSQKPATAETANAAIAAAEASRSKADAVGYEWRDTAAMIDEAKKAMEAKNYAKAIELAGTAEQQGKLAVAQHADQQAAYKAMKK